MPGHDTGIGAGIIRRSCWLPILPRMTKTKVVSIAAAVVVAGLATLAVRSQRSQARLAQRLASERAEWTAEKAELEELAARAERPRAETAPATAALSPQEILARLQRLQPAGNPTRNLQLAVYWLEELGRHHQAALPAVSSFLATGQDLDLDVSWYERGRGWRDRLPGDFVAPPSLRFGLFGVVRQIGGKGAEELLAATLATKRGVELAYLTRVLQEIAPDAHREQAITAARQLLKEAGSAHFSSPLDKNHREHLLSVLAFYGDQSYVAQAQTMLIKPEGIDRGALEYLRQALGAKSVGVVAQVYADQRVLDQGKREPLNRLALRYVPFDPEATELWKKAINDPGTPKHQRQDLIEDLNDHGFPDPKHLTQRDLPLVESRLALIEQLAPATTDPVNIAAFAEAKKDLLAMKRYLEGNGPEPR